MVMGLYFVFAVGFAIGWIGDIEWLGMLWSVWLTLQIPYINTIITL